VSVTANPEHRRATAAHGAGSAFETVAAPGQRGATRIADVVVAKIAGAAAREVPGVQATGSGMRRVAAEIGLGKARAHGVSVEVGQREAAVDLEVVAEYGADVGQVGQQVRESVTRRVRDLTDLDVVEVNVVVTDIRHPRDDAEEGRRTDRDPNRQPAIVRRLQRRRRSYQQHGLVYRGLWVAAGATILLAGIVMLALPGPAFLVIPLGLAMLSFEFAWAQRFLDTGISSSRLAARRVGQASPRQKLLGAAAVGLALLAVVALLIALL